MQGRPRSNQTHFDRIFFCTKCIYQFINSHFCFQPLTYHSWTILYRIISLAAILFLKMNACEMASFKTWLRDLCRSIASFEKRIHSYWNYYNWKSIAKGSFRFIWVLLNNFGIFFGELVYFSLDIRHYRMLFLKWIHK